MCVMKDGKKVTERLPRQGHGQIKQLFPEQYLRCCFCSLLHIWKITLIDVWQGMNEKNEWHILRFISGKAWRTGLVCSIAHNSHQKYMMCFSESSDFTNQSLFGWGLGSEHLYPGLKDKTAFCGNDEADKRNTIIDIVRGITVRYCSVM